MTVYLVCVSLPEDTTGQVLSVHATYAEADQVVIDAWKHIRKNSGIWSDRRYYVTEAEVGRRPEFVEKFGFNCILPAVEEEELEEVISRA